MAPPVSPPLGSFARKEGNHALPPVYRDRNRVHPVTKAVVGSRAIAEDLNKIRSKIYRIVLELLELDSGGECKEVVANDDCRRALESMASVAGIDGTGGPTPSSEAPSTTLWPITEEETRAIDEDETVKSGKELVNW